MTIASTDEPSWVDTAHALRELGWAGALPLPPSSKSPPPTGFTGGDGCWPTDDDLTCWATTLSRSGARLRYPADANLCVRLPLDVVGIDLDVYKGIEVEDTWADLWDTRGELPMTVITTSRHDGSGIRLYRVRPEAWDTPGELPTTVWAEGIECIRHGHRYAVIAPSIHPDGPTYRWIDEETGEILALPPRPEDLPDLPEAWYGGWADKPEPVAQLPLNRPTPSLSPSPAPSIADWWCNEAPGDFLGDLTSAGWQVSHQHGQDIYLVRPGKAVKDGHSAVLHPSGALMVFSSDPTLKPLHDIGSSKAEGVALSRFHFLAATRHGGDMSAAGRWAREARDGPPLDPHNLITPARPDTPPQADAIAKPEARYQLLQGTEIRAIPQPTPLIDGYLDTSSLALLFGAYGSGKTFVALDWAFRVAAGIPYLGHHVAQGPVVIIAAEGSTGMAARFDSWCDHHHIDPATMTDVYWLPASPQLTAWADIDELVRILTPIAPALIVVDTVARTAVGVEENSAKEMGVWVDGAETLIRALADTGIAPCVLAIHHAGKDAERGSRGNTALPAAAAAVFRVRGDAAHAEVDCERQKDRERSPRAVFHLEPVGASVVPVWSDHRDGPGAGVDMVRVNVLAQLRQVADSAHGASATVWKTAVLERGVCSNSSFYEHKRELVDSGYVEQLGDKRTAPFQITATGRQHLNDMT